MKLLSIFLFMAMTVSAKDNVAAQDYTAYYDLCNQAQVEMANAHWAKAIPLYEKAFQNYFPFFNDAEMLLRCYKENQQYEKHDSLVSWLDNCGCYEKRESFLIVPGHPSKESWQKEKPQYLSAGYVPPVMAEQKRVSDESLAVFEIIESFIQVVRPKIEDEHKSQLITLYATSGLLLIKRLQSGTFPSREESRVWEGERFAIAIIHAIPYLRETDFRELMGLLWQQVLVGNMSPTQYTILYDSRFREENEHGVIFSLKEVGEDNQMIYEFKPIRDVKNVDERRKAILLPPLWVYAKLKNLDLPKGYR